MKTLKFSLVALIAMSLFSCSKDLSQDLGPLSDDQTEVQSKVPAAAGVDFVVENPETAAELQELFTEIANINTPKQAWLQGWNSLLEVYFPNMGYHYINPENIGDGVFDMLKPDAIVVACDNKNNYRAVAVEYIVPYDAAGAPEGFSGDEDEWSIFYDPDGNPLFWTLHVWLKLHNPDGVFAKNNPEVASEDICGTPPAPEE